MILPGPRVKVLFFSPYFMKLLIDKSIMRSIDTKCQVLKKITELYITD